MINIILTVLLLTFSTTVFAVPLLSSINYALPSPPKDENVLSLYQYLNTLYNRWNTLQVTTQEPNGNVDANYGNIIIYYDGTDYWLSIQTAKPDGTVWKGIKLGAV